MSSMTPNKTFLSLLLKLIRHFLECLNLLGNSMYVLRDNGLKIEICFRVNLHSIVA